MLERKQSALSSRLFGLNKTKTQLISGPAEEEQGPLRRSTKTVHLAYGSGLLLKDLQGFKPINTHWMAWGHFVGYLTNQFMLMRYAP